MRSRANLRKSEASNEACVRCRRSSRTEQFWFPKETKGDFQMPVAYLDLTSGLTVDVKKKLVKEVAGFMHDAWMIPDTRVFLREWPAEQTSVDGELARPIRPICSFHGPRLPAEATKRQLINR